MEELQGVSSHLVRVPALLNDMLNDKTYEKSHAEIHSLDTHRFTAQGPAATISWQIDDRTTLELFK